MPEQETQDRVYSSRKFVVTILCVVLIALGGLICVKLPAFAGIYPSYIGGILGMAGIYLTGNVANDFLNNKTKASIQIEHIKTTGTTIEANKESTVPSLELSEVDKSQDGE